LSLAIIGAIVSFAGIKRMRPDLAVFTLQGDGDMANEGLQEVLHAAARGEKVTCVMLNNGVFGDTGGQQTATTVVGQRTKTSLDGRDPSTAGYPIPVADLVAQLRGTAYVARAAVSTAAGVAQTKRMLRKAFETQLSGAGFSLVEILTMCPTGWFIETGDAPDYLAQNLESYHRVGVIKDIGLETPAS